MTHLRRSLLAFALLIAISASVFPMPAHAAGGAVGEVVGWAAGGVVSEILDLIIGLLEVVHKILAQLIVIGGQLLNWIIGLEVNYGGAAVYNVWKVFRDICNSLFIVLFVLIAFGTIFHSTVKGLSAYYYKSALMSVIFAAILINFSLPIGQTIVWAGNQAANLVAGFVSGTKVAETILTQGQVLQVAVGKNGLSLAAAPMESVPDDQLDPVQLITKKNYAGSAKIVFDNCIKFGQAPISECSARAARIQANDSAAAVDREIARLSENPSMLSRFTDIWNYWSNTAQGAVKGATSAQGVGSVLTGNPVGFATAVGKGAWSGAVLGNQPVEPANLSITDKALKVLSLIINNFFFGVLALGFATVIIFLVMRIPFTWFYLAISSMAFFSAAVPGSKARGEWFGNIIGWSIFAPLYLFVIYIGMFVLQQQNALLAGLKDAGAFAGIFGVALFYVITGGIFIGGAGWAWNYAFSLSADLKKYGGGFADAIGVGAKSKFGFNTVADKTGLSSSYEAARARGQQFVGDRSANIKGTLPGLFKTNEESVAYKKMKLGVRGADAEVDKLAQKRIKAQTEMLDGRGLDEKALQGILNGGNSDAAMAAGEMLLKKGKLEADDKAKLEKLYEGVSPIAAKEFKKRMVEQLQKGSAGAWDAYLGDSSTIDPVTGKPVQEFKFDKFSATAKSIGKPEDVRKFLDAAMRGEVGNRQLLTKAQLEQLVGLMNGSAEDQRAFLEGATKNGRNKVAAIEMMVNRDLITNRDGTRTSMADAMDDRAGSFSDNDLLDAEEYFHTSPDPMPDSLKAKLKESLKKPEKFKKISRNTVGPDQLTRITNEHAAVQAASIGAKKTLKEIEKKDRKYTQGIKRLRKKEEKLKNVDEKKRMAKWIEDLEVRRGDMKEQMQKLRKDII